MTFLVSPARRRRQPQTVEYHVVSNGAMRAAAERAEQRPAPTVRPHNAQAGIVTSPLALAILEYVAEAPGARFQQIHRAVRQQVECTRDSVGARLTTLVELQHVERRGERNYYRYYPKREDNAP